MNDDEYRECLEGFLGMAVVPGTELIPNRTGLSQQGWNELTRGGNMAAAARLNRLAEAFPHISLRAYRPLLWTKLEPEQIRSAPDEYLLSLRNFGREALRSIRA